MIYYIPDYEHEADTLETAQDFLIELCEKHGEVEKPTEIWETIGRLKNGDIDNPKRVWLATCYVAVEGGPFYAPNHPDNGDDPEYDVDLTEICPQCKGYKTVGEEKFNIVTMVWEKDRCTACKGTGRPAAPAEDAVEVLRSAHYSAIGRGYDRYNGIADFMLQYITERGYTLRRETMTEAELEREACYLHSRAQAGNDTVDEIMELAKKYRG